MGLKVCLRVCRRVSSPDMGMVVAVTDMAAGVVMGSGRMSPRVSAAGAAVMAGRVMPVSVMGGIAVMVMAGMAVVAVMGMGEAGRVPVVAVSDRLAVAGLFFLRCSGMQGGVSG